jgi:hypothetical protein
MQETENKILNINETALFLGVNRKTIRNWCEEKLIPFIDYPGNKKKFLYNRLNEWRELKEVFPKNMEIEKQQRKQNELNENYKKQLKEAKKKLEKHFPKKN